MVQCIIFNIYELFYAEQALSKNRPELFFRLLLLLLSPVKLNVLSDYFIIIFIFCSYSRVFSFDFWCMWLNCAFGLDVPHHPSEFGSVSLSFIVWESFSLCFCSVVCARFCITLSVCTSASVAALLVYLLLLHTTCKWLVQIYICFLFGEHIKKYEIKIINRNANKPKLKRKNKIALTNTRASRIFYIYSQYPFKFEYKQFYFIFYLNETHSCLFHIVEYVSIDRSFVRPAHQSECCVFGHAFLFSSPIDLCLNIETVFAVQCSPCT